MHDCYWTPKISLHEHTNVTDRSKVTLINVSKLMWVKLTIWNVKFVEYNSYEYEKPIGHRAYD